MGQIDRVDEVRSRRYKRMPIAEPEEGRVGPNPVRVLDAAGNLKRVISSAELQQRDPDTGQESPQTAPRAYLPTAKRDKGSMKLLGTRSWA